MEFWCGNLLKSSSWKTTVVVVMEDNIKIHRLMQVGLCGTE
jgi:hypothetical protein